MERGSRAANRKNHALQQGTVHSTAVHNPPQCSWGSVWKSNFLPAPCHALHPAPPHLGSQISQEGVEMEFKMCCVASQGEIEAVAPRLEQLGFSSEGGELWLSIKNNTPLGNSFSLLCTILYFVCTMVSACTLPVLCDISTCLQPLHKDAKFMWRVLTPPWVCEPQAAVQHVFPKVLSMYSSENVHRSLVKHFTLAFPLVPPYTCTWELWAECVKQDEWNEICPLSWCRMFLLGGDAKGNF